MRAVLEYWTGSFGNKTRLDYGTGHETTFAVWLYCLQELQMLGTADYQAIGLCVFPAYLRVVHKLIQEYSLEPAGSHGAWSLVR